MTLYVITTGQVINYPPEYTTAHECAMNRPAVLATYDKVLKKRLEVGDAYLLCHPKDKKAKVIK